MMSPGRRLPTPTPTRVPTVEAGGNELGRTNNDLGAEHRAHRALQAPRIETGFRREADDLSPRVHAGVGAARARKLDLVPQDLGDRLSEHTADGAYVRLTWL